MLRWQSSPPLFLTFKRISVMRPPPKKLTGTDQLSCNNVFRIFRWRAKLLRRLSKQKLFGERHEWMHCRMLNKRFHRLNYCNGAEVCLGFLPQQEAKFHLFWSCCRKFKVRGWYSLFRTKTSGWLIPQHGQCKEPVTTSTAWSMNLFARQQSHGRRAPWPFCIFVAEWKRQAASTKSEIFGDDHIVLSTITYIQIMSMSNLTLLLHCNSGCAYLLCCPICQQKVTSTCPVSRTVIHQESFRPRHLGSRPRKRPAASGGYRRGVGLPRPAESEVGGKAVPGFLRELKSNSQ